MEQLSSTTANSRTHFLAVVPGCARDRGARRPWSARSRRRRVPAPGHSAGAYRRSAPRSVTPEPPATGAPGPFWRPGTSGRVGQRDRQASVESARGSHRGQPLSQRADFQKISLWTRIDLQIRSKMAWSHPSVPLVQALFIPGPFQQRDRGMRPVHF